MKIGIVSTHDQLGGAARAAYRLHQGLLKQNCISTMYVQQKQSDVSTIIRPSSKYDNLRTAVISRLDPLPLLRYPNRNKRNFATGCLNSLNLSKVSNEIDVFNFHWVGSAFQSINSIANIKKPLILSLHDSWAFTGGCYIPYECTKFLTQCGECNQLNSTTKSDLSYKIWKKKMDSWNSRKDIVLVGDGTWVANNAQNSSIFKNHRIEVIHPGLDLNVYKPINKISSREILGLSGNDKVILFGAYNATEDPNKGFQLLKPALEKLAETFSDIANLKFIVFGASSSFEKSNVIKGVETRYVGKLSDDISLSVLYSAADVMVVPSKYEAFGQTASESFACGTPVVAFNTSGLKDIIDHKINGFLAKPYDSMELAEGISWVLSDPARLNQLCIEARSKAVRKFGIERCVDEYFKMYESVLK